MTDSTCRTSCSAVIELRESRSFVAILLEEYTRVKHVMQYHGFEG